MASAPTPRGRADFHVAILCALPLEAEVVIHALDQVWEDKRYEPPPNDDGAYTLGAIGQHNVVVVHMPGMGTSRATAAVLNLKYSYVGVKLALVVGICGGMPKAKDEEEIFLGDVVISKSLIQYDFGKQYDEGFVRSPAVLDTLNAPNEKILGLLVKLETEKCKRELQTATVAVLQTIQQKTSKANHPGLEHDVLYQSSYAHRHRKPGQCHTCEITDDICQDAIDTKCEDLGCEAVIQTPRRRLLDRSDTQPAVHIGAMGSANTVMKSGQYRDNLAREEGIFAVEMEGAGVWRYSPSLVVKGVCDYADGHKRKRWQRYAAATAAACAKALLLKRWVPEVQGNCSENSNAYFEVPAQRVKTLFGRDDELTTILAHFERAADDVKRPRMLVLQAMGGQGKSQIALEYCHRTYARQTHHGIFWVNSSSDLTMTQSLVIIARQIGVVATEAFTDDESRAKFAIRTLERWEHRWLIVFDNCDDAETFSALRKKFLPKVGIGDILFTSRHHSLGELSIVVSVPSMPADASVQLLLHRYGPDIDHDEHRMEALKIVKRLGYLALAIDQASAYMQDQLMPLDQLHTFLSLYVAQREEVLEHTTPDFWNYMKIHGDDEQETAIGAFTTWEMTFSQLLHQQKKNQDDVRHFFSLSAFFEPTRIEESLFRLHWGDHKPPAAWMSIFATDGGWQPGSFWRTVRQAFQMSLVQDLSRASASSEACFSFHPLVRDWLQLRLGVEYRQAFTREATDILCSSIRAYRSRARDAQMKNVLLLHIESVIACDNEYFPDKHRLGHEIFTCDAATLIASFYRDRGQYNDNTTLLGRVTLTRVRVLGAEDPNTLTSMNSLALVLGEQGKYSEAERMHRQVVQVQERVLGAEHPDTLSSMNNLATVLGEQGKYSEAEQMHRQAVVAIQRVLGAEHPETLISMSNLATVLIKQGKYSEAEQILRRGLEVRKRVLGAEHPDTLISMNSLATVLNKQGKYSEAEQILHRGLEVRKLVLGAEHPSTLISMSNLATMLGEQGKYSEAEQMHLRGLEVRKRVLGAEHPGTLSSMHNLATVLNNQGKHSEAEQMHRHVVQVQERVLGAEHPDTLSSMNNLATVLSKQGKHSEAEQMHRQAVVAIQRVLGAEHPSTLISMNNLATVLGEQGKYSEAEQMHRQAVVAIQRVLGAEHPSTLISMNNLALVLRYQGKYSEAEQIQTQAARSSCAVFGSHHPNTKSMLNTLLTIWKEQERAMPEITDALQDILGSKSSSSR